MLSERILSANRSSSAQRYRNVESSKAKNRIEYFVACVAEFAKAFGLDDNKSFDYLDRYRGLDFLSKCYEAEHTVSFADAVGDMQKVCRRNGGSL